MEKLLKIKGPNGALAAVLHPADPEKIVLFAHGYTGTKCESGRLFVQTARALAEAGISALRFDFWASGDSEGGFEEVSPNTEIADLHSVIAWARSRRFSEIGVLGLEHLSKRISVIRWERRGLARKAQAKRLYFPYCPSLQRSATAHAAPANRKFFLRNALSLGGAVSICTAAENPHVKTLVTWSAVPKFADWIKGVVNADGKIEKNPIHGGPGRSTDHPRVDVPEAYVSLKIPKLQIQGDRDLAGFREGFETYFPAASAPKKHVVLPGADHVFTTWRDRQKVIRHTVKWFQKYL